MRLIITYLISILTLFATNTYAATINAASCSLANVQSAINSAANGDTVMVPAGSCTWASNISIPNTKGITLQGAGSGQTIITTNATLVVDTLPANAPVRITGFNFIRTGMATRISIFGTAQNWRIDNNIFDDANISGPYTIQIGQKGDENLDSYNFGVIDHNQFINRNYGTSVHINWVRWGSSQLDTVASGDWIWSQPAQRGTAQAVYIEDNVFSGNNTASQVVDTQYGGKAVVRYNTINNPWIATHSACTNSGETPHGKKSTKILSQRQVVYMEATRLSYDLPQESYGIILLPHLFLTLT
jgi:hypothetical protein